MIPFVTIGARDRAASNAFYDAVLGALGYARTRNDERWTAYGQSPDRREVFVGAPFDGEARGGNGIMVAFEAGTADAVRAAHAAGLKAGGTDEGAPAYRPADSTWYGAYLRDPTGNKICICVDN